MQQTDPVAQTTRHVREVAALGDLIGWNECGTPAIRDAILALPGWSSYIPGGTAGDIPISWRTDLFDLVGSGSILVHGGVAHATPSRYINWVRLRDKSTGRVFTRINTHVVHHIEVAGHPRIAGAIPGQENRARAHFQRLREAIVTAAALGATIVGGDFNVDYLAEFHMRPEDRTPWFPLTALSSVATPVMPKSGTHGSRAIDWTLLAGPVKAVSQVVLAHGSSDHNPVLTVVELT